MSERLDPIVVQYALTVSVPMGTPVIILQGEKIQEAENDFVFWRDKTSDHARKVELDRARGVLKYAATLGASLKEMHNKERNLEITLTFSSFDMLNMFNENMADAVASATMK